MPRKPGPRPICEICQQPFTPKSRVALSRVRFCSNACRGVWRANDPTIRAHMASIAGNMKGRKRRGVYGPQNPAWKGGATYKRSKGNYIGPKYVRCPAAFLTMARSDGYVMEHRLLMAQRLGRCLVRQEVVHHLDHNPRNNAPENLELWPDNASHKAMEHGRLVSGAACLLSLTASVQL